MKLRGHGNGLALTLSALAVVFAASGTAYAVTATVVNIADPSAPSRVAKVDAASRLSTADPTSTLSISAISFPSAAQNNDLYSSPTTATLAVTKFSVTPLSPVSATWSVYLFQVPVKADGTCSTTSTVRSLGYGTVVAGQLGGQDYSSPLVVTPIGGAPYCLDVYYRLASGSANGSENFGIQLTGYVVSGRYTAAAGAPDAAADTAVPKSAAVGGR